MDVHRWMADFKEDQQNARAEVLSSLLRLENKTDIVVEVLAAQQSGDPQFVDKVMDKMQCVSADFFTLSCGLPHNLVLV